MITLNDYLYSGDTVLRILQKYMGDLREEAKRNHNEIDIIPDQARHLKELIRKFKIK